MEAQKCSIPLLFEIPIEEAIDLHDLELGSGGVALLPTDVTNGRQIAIAYSKEGRLFLVNTDTMGKFNGGGDNQIAQEFMVGQYTCSDTVTADVAEGPGWNRLEATSPTTVAAAVSSATQC